MTLRSWRASSHRATAARTSSRAPHRPRVYWFSREQRVAQGAFLRGDEILFRNDGQEEVVLKREEIPLTGAHNLENVLAAVTATRLAGAPAQSIAKAIRSFAGVEHRLEFVAEIAGVRYYNDSKATNLDAVEKALAAQNKPVVLIAGGKDKGFTFDPLRSLVKDKVKSAVLIGEMAASIRRSWDGAVKSEIATSLADAVERARSLASAGDVVLFSPGTSSFDMFKSYADRGDQFRKLVQTLPQ